MPTIPRLEGRTVLPSPLPTPAGADAGPAGAYGGTIAAGLQSAADTLGGLAQEKARIADEERRKQDEARVTAAIGDSTNFTLHFLTDPQAGVLNLEGEKAFGIADAGSRQLATQYAQTEQGLVGDDQKRAYRRWADESLARNTLALQRHEAEARDTNDAQHTKATLAATRDHAAAMYTDPGIVADGDAYTYAIAHTFMERHGADAETAARAAAEAVSAYHVAVVGQYGEDYAGTKRYLETYGDQILPEARQGIDKKLQTLGVRAQGQAAADKAWRTSKGDLGSALDAVNSIDDVELRDEAGRRVRQLAQDADASRRQSEEAVFNQAEPLFRAGGERVAAIPSGVWAQLPTDKRDYFRRAEDAAASGTELKLENVPQATLKDLFDYKELKPEAAVDVNLWDRFGAKLPRSMFFQLVDKQNEYRAAIAKDDGKKDVFTALQTPDAVVKQEAQLAGVIPFQDSAASDDQRRTYIAYEERANQEINAFERQKYGGKQKASPEEIRKIVQPLLIRGVLDNPDRPALGRQLFGSLGLPEKYAFQVEPGQTLDIEISEDERKQIVDALAAHGLPTTSDAVLGLYLRAHGAPR